MCLALTNSAYLYKRPELLLILLKNGVRKKNDHWNNTMYLYSLHMGIPTLEQATSSYTHTAFTRSVTHSFLLPHTFFSFISVHKHTHTRTPSHSTPNQHKCIESDVLRLCFLSAVVIRCHVAGNASGYLFSVGFFVFGVTVAFSLPASLSASHFPFHSLNTIAVLSVLHSTTTIYSQSYHARVII